MEIRKNITKLPATFQTETLSKFFESTVDQLLSGRNSEKLDGFVGRRVGGCYDVNNDFYIGEKTKDRANYQLEPAALTKDPNTFDDENIVLYQDLLNTLRFYGANISNHDRLFESPYYSFSPPIDIDKFLNYYQYSWVPSFDSIPAIRLENIDESLIVNEIIGNESFNTKARVTVDVVAGEIDSVNIVWAGAFYTNGVGFELVLLNTAGGGNQDAIITYDVVNGMITNVQISNVGSGYTNGTDISVIELPDSVAFSSGFVITFPSAVSGTYSGKKYVVEGVGRQINLIPAQNQLLPFDQFVFIPWDFNGDPVTGTGDPWDSLPWDSQLGDPRPDYITIERGACDNNGWSRTNSWYHNDVLATIVNLTGIEIPESSLGRRPIIEFRKDIEFFKSGTRFLSEVSLVGTDVAPITITPETLNGLVGLSVATDNPAVDLNIVENGNLIIFAHPMTRARVSIDVVNGNISSASLISGGDSYLPNKLNQTFELKSTAGGNNGLIFYDTNSSGEMVNVRVAVQGSGYTDGIGIEVSQLDVPYPTTSQYIYEVSVGLDLTVDINEHTLAEEGDIVIVVSGENYSGATYYYDGEKWSSAASQKTGVNIAPKYQLYDYLGNRLDNTSVYPDTNFNGSELFSYKINTNSTARDSVLGFPLEYTGLGQISDIVFENDLQTQRFKYVIGNVAVDIPGYYFYNAPAEDQGCELNPRLTNEWKYFDSSKQRVIDRYIVKDSEKTAYELSVLPYLADVIVKVDGVTLDVDIDYTVANNEIRFIKTLVKDQVVEMFTYAREKAVETYVIDNIGETRYELTHTPENGDINITSNITGPIFDFALVDKYIVFGNSVTLTVGEEITATYVSSDNLSPEARGYYEIPQSLENNPENQEVLEHSYNDLSEHFLSIITNQDGIGNVRLGEKNGYRDTKKDTSKGSMILQNTSSLLKAMFITSNRDVNVIESIRFSQNEYERFKKKFLRTVYEMNLNNEFSNIQSIDNSVEFDAWFNEVISRINQSSGTNTTFNHSHMIALGTVYQEEEISLTAGSDDGSGNISVELSNYADLSDLKNTLYLFSKQDNVDPLSGQQILLDTVDYTVVSTEIPIIVKITENIARQVLGTRQEITAVTISTAGSNYQTGDVLTLSGGIGTSATVRVTGVSSGGVVTSVEIVSSGEYITPPANPVTSSGGSGTGAEFNIVSAPRVRIDKIYARLYENPNPASHIPSTPAKLGMAQSSRPRYITDNTFPTPGTPNSAGFILGHDGSRTAMVGDIRDKFLLEFEKRIYNGISKQFKNDFIPLVNYFDVWPGKFRDTNYTIGEVNDIFKASFSKWANSTKKNWRTNDTYDINNEWTYNYKANGLNEGNTPGNWRGIYYFYYDTATPHTRPWEMVGFVNRPTWWVSVYGADYSSNNIAMWQDLEDGRIASGTREGTYEQFKRPGLVAEFLPVDASGNLRTPIDIGLTAYPALDRERSADWVFGDYAPIEKEWRDTSSYAFSLMELLYLTKPAKFSELFWDTKETTRSSADPTQIINVLTGQRSKPADIIVHGESVAADTVIKLGYQQWIGDRLTFMRSSITTLLGERIRTLRTKLAHKMAGYTVEETFDLYSEAISPDSSTNTLLLPKESIDLKLQKGPSIDDYIYSGVIIRKNEENRFQLYGYDLLHCKFITHDRKDNGRGFEINVGGNTASYREFLPERSYKAGEFVRYNTVFYRANRDVFANRFVQEDWTKVNKLPTNGGTEATYYPDRNKNKTSEFLYGHEFDTVQEVFDFLIGYESYLKSRGWIFEEVDPNTNVLSDFLESAKQFLSWVSMNFDSESVIVLSPLAAGAKLKVERGYPDNVERTNNGVYSILDEQGVVIDPRMTAVLRKDSEIKVIPLQDDVRVYYMRVSASETEHVFTLDNITTFNDVIFDPLLGIRQPRVRMAAVRTKDWIGKFEAPGYIINEQLKLIPNIENTTESIRRYHDTESQLDIRRVEDTARHLIGYEEKDYLVNLQLDDDVQYQFYQGAIREKGTEESIKKLLRSVFVTSEQDITTYEEWALKIADYGAVCENQSFDVSIVPSELKTDPQLVILDTPISRTGSIKEIIVINSEDQYDTPPAIRIVKGPGDHGNGGGAIAAAVLDDAGFIIRIDVINPGRGYIKEPLIYITDGVWDGDPWETYGWDYGTNDKALAVLQKNVTVDRQNDDIIYIDVDSPERWIKKPRTCGLSDLYPTYIETNFTIPNSGWASLADVDNTLFDVNNFIQLFETNSTDAPIITQSAIYNESSDSVVWANVKRETIYIAKARLGSTQFSDKSDVSSDDWNIYRATDADMSYGESFKFTTDEEGLIIELDKPAILPNDPEDRRFIGGVIVVNIRRTVQKKPLRTEIINLAYQLQLIDFEGEEYLARYRLLDSNGVLATLDEELIENLDSNPLYEANIWIYTGMRFDTIAQRNNFQEDNGIAGITFLSGELSWINQNDSGLWEVQKLSSDGETWQTHVVTNEVNNRVVETQRIEAPQLDTSKFKNAILYGLDDNETIFMLPVYDPYKGLIPGIADQNIDFISEVDPARYAFAGNDVLVDENIMFGSQQVGRLWWDTSTMRYINYEQGSNRERRDFWGKLFPGSIINVYEWVRSTSTPANYSGDGTPRNVTDYAEYVEYDPSLQKELTVYYFWVSNKSSVPANIKNRTSSARSVAALLSNPTSRGYRWFAPINSHSNKDSLRRKFATWNIPVIENIPTQVDGDVINATRYQFTIPYEYFENLEIRIVPGQGNINTPFDDKDLLVEGVHYTVSGNLIKWSPAFVFPNNGIDPSDRIEVTYRVYTENDDRNAFIIANVNNTLSSQETVLQVNYSYLDEDASEHSEWHLVREGDEDSRILDQHWNKMVDSVLGQTDIVEWSADVSGFCSTTANRGFLLVPDPSLNDAEKCGSSYRPRQTWFAHMNAAREIFVKKMNQLLGEICIRDLVPLWEDTFGSEGNSVWEWVDWYAPGWSQQTALPSRQVNTVTEMEQLSNIKDGEIIKVLDPNETDSLFTLFVYDSTTEEYNIVARENCTVELQDIIFTENPPSTDRTIELRKIIQFVERKVFIVNYLINKNKIFFTMLNYSLSEKLDNDWAFKTTYLVINQSGIEFEQKKFLDLDPVDSIVQYVNSIKPYHCKIRDYSTSRSAGTDFAPGQATEIRLMNPTLMFSRVTCHTIGIVKRGEGYAVNDIITVETGNPNDNITARVLEVSFDGETYRTEKNTLGEDVFGGISSVIALTSGNTMVPEQTVYSVTGGQGTGATVVVALNKCDNAEIRRDAKSFITPTYPWDAVDWDDCPWDGIMPINYYSASDPQLPVSEQFAGVQPELTLPTINKISNGTFNTDTLWVKGDGWSIAGNAASSDGSQTANSDLSQALPGLTENNYYRVKFTISGIVSGTVTPVVGDTEGTPRSSNGTYVETIVAGPGADVELRADLDFIGDIENVSVKQVAGETIVLPFTPTNNSIDNGPYVMLNGKEFFNFTYETNSNTITLFQEDVPTFDDKMEIFNILPFDGGSFLQPYVRENTPEELAPLDANERLVIHVHRTKYRCIARTTPHVYWLPDSDVDIGSLGITVDGTPLLSSDFSVVGPLSWDNSYDIVKNGNFTSTADWTLGNDWSISGNKASLTSVGTVIDRTLSQVNSPVGQGFTYDITFTVSDYVSGSITPYIGNGAGQAVNGNGTYTQTVQAFANNKQFRFVGDATFVGSIEDVSIRPSNSYAWDPINSCEGPPWDAEVGILIHSGFSGTEELIFDYDTNTRELPDAFNYVYYMDPQGWQEIYRVCADETSTLVSDVVFGDDQLVLNTAAIPALDGASLKLPKHVWVGGELIAYHKYDNTGPNVILSNLVRGAKGTSITDLHSSGKTVYAARQENLMPNINLYSTGQAATGDLTVDQTTFLSNC